MRHRKRLGALAVTAAVTALAAIGVQLLSGTASGSQTANQTIDSKTDPAGAAKAVDLCEVISNCKFVQNGGIAIKLDPPRVLGDALYNCGQAEAEDIVALSDERSESTSLEESISVKASLSFLGLAKASLEAEVNSKQKEEVATKLKQTNGVNVEPNSIGYTTSQVPTAYINGSAQVNNAGSTITVTNLEVAYPGFGDKVLNKMVWGSIHKDMTDKDRHDRCAALPPIFPTAAGATQAPGPQRVVVCTAHGGCQGRMLSTGGGEAIPAGAKLTLARGRVIYATGTAGKRRTVLHASRTVPAGRYTLLISRPHSTTMLAVKLSAA